MEIPFHRLVISLRLYGLYRRTERHSCPSTYPDWLIRKADSSVPILHIELLLIAMFDSFINMRTVLPVILGIVKEYMPLAALPASATTGPPKLKPIKWNPLRSAPCATRKFTNCAITIPTGRQCFTAPA